MGEGLPVTGKTCWTTQAVNWRLYLRKPENKTVTFAQEPHPSLYEDIGQEWRLRLYLLILFSAASIYS